jgi:hypothetical protein
MWMQRWQIKREIEKHDAGDPKQNKTGDEQQETIWYAISARIHTIGEHLHTQGEEQSRQDRKRASRETKMLILVGVTAFFAFGSDWIFYRQLSGMRDDQRPWVGLHGVDHVQNANAFMVSIINSGKSPAMHVRAVITGGPVGVAPIQVPDKACGSDCTFDDIVMLPNVPIGRRIPPLGEPLALFSAQIWIAIRVDYSDTAGAVHSYRACFIEVPPYGDTKSCPKPNRNYAD